MKTYSIVSQKDRTFGVHITSSRTFPGTVPGFLTEAEAEAFIIEQKDKDSGEHPREPNIVRHAAS